jgi:hypothetical protein
VRLTLEQCIAMNAVEQRMHLQREVVVAAELGAEIPACALCGVKLSEQGRLWQEGEELERIEE